MTLDFGKPTARSAASFVSNRTASPSSSWVQVNRRRDRNASSSSTSAIAPASPRSCSTRKSSAVLTAAKAEAALQKYVVAVKPGPPRRRSRQPQHAHGTSGVVAANSCCSASETPPAPAEEAIANEEVRLKYRYLDLRRTEMQYNFALRSKVAMAIRNYLVGEGFLEIETPFMTRSTPEGARDARSSPRSAALSWRSTSPQIAGADRR